MKLEYIFYAILAVVVIVRFIVQVRNATGGHVLTGHATVVSKRVQEGNYQNVRRNAKTWYVNSAWNYLVTFRLSDGEEIELHTFDVEYHALEEGMTGQLTWHKQNMTGFEPDVEVSL